MTQLSDLYDADRRTRDPQARQLAATKTIQHPLNNVQYADGISSCRHAMKHQRFQHCPQEFRADPPGKTAAAVREPEKEDPS
ncbi:hypothetical protein [Streptomyces sp. MMS24-I29]|uniref:hypothetical protein n=1 Tax=Streptomyces sp. MMS24-I29 TaxID=3351480 RepID=UPI003C7AFB8F